MLLLTLLAFLNEGNLLEQDTSTKDIHLSWEILIPLSIHHETWKVMDPTHYQQQVEIL